MLMHLNMGISPSLALASFIVFNGQLQPETHRQIVPFQHKVVFLRDRTFQSRSLGGLFEQKQAFREQSKRANKKENGLVAKSKNIKNQNH